MKPDTTSIPALITWLESRDFGAHGVYGLQQSDAADICQALRSFSRTWNAEWRELQAYREGRIRPDDPKSGLRDTSDPAAHAQARTDAHADAAAFNAGILTRIADALALLAEVHARDYYDQNFPPVMSQWSRENVAARERLLRGLQNGAVLLRSRRPSTE